MFKLNQKCIILSTSNIFPNRVGYFYDRQEIDGKNIIILTDQPFPSKLGNVVFGVEEKFVITFKLT